MFKPVSSRPQPRQFHDLLGSSLSVLDVQPLLTQRLDFLNAPMVKTTESDVKNFNKINGQISLKLEPRSAPPLNLLGGGQYRFANALTGNRNSYIAAAIDAEVGMPAATPVVSSDGVVAYRIPRRVR